MKLESLSAFFPCYNEEANVEPMAQELLAVLPKAAKKFEIIIINDGSTDATGEIADRLAKKHKNIRVIHHPKNAGYGVSLRSGFSAAQYEWIFFTDGDMQFDLTQLTSFIPSTQAYQVVIGYRTHRADGTIRALNARLFKFYIDLLFRVHVKDIDCAFKLLRRKAIQSLPLQSTGAFTSSEFLYRLKKKGYLFKQIPVNHFPRQFGQSTGNNPRVVIKAALEALKLYVEMKLQN